MMYPCTSRPEHSGTAQTDRGAFREVAAGQCHARTGGERSHRWTGLARRRGCAAPTVFAGWCLHPGGPVASQSPRPQRQIYRQCWLRRSRARVMREATVVDRIGRRSRFASEGGTSVAGRGLPPRSGALPFERCRVLKPFEAEVGTAGPVPEFGAPGGAKQYPFCKSVQQLIDEGFLGVVP